MAEPARKPQPAQTPTKTSAAAGAGPAPQLRPRAYRDPSSADEPAAQHVNEPRRLQERVAAAFTARDNTALEKTLMRLIIIAATCLVVLSAVGQGGVLSGLFR